MCDTKRKQITAGREKRKAASVPWLKLKSWIEIATYWSYNKLKVEKKKEKKKNYGCFRVIFLQAYFWRSKDSLRA